MKAIVTTGNGGYDKLVYSDVPVPKISAGEVLVKVLAAGMNNTEINTRLGWYSSAVTGSTEMTSDVERTLVGKRVLIRPCIRAQGFGSLDNIWMGSDFDGAFAEYVKIPAGEVFPVDCDWTDAELGAIPCAYGTAETMLLRANLKAGETVLIAGASGGVGSAAVQLAKRRGAKIIAIADKAKHTKMAEFGIDVLLDRSADLLAELGESSVDVVVDNVAGSTFASMIKLLKRGGRLVSSGAIAGPVVNFDMRDMYLKDISIIGSTAWDEQVFPDLVRYIEQDEIHPNSIKTFPLSSIVEAQQEFLTKKHVGKFVLIPLHGT